VAVGFAVALFLTGSAVGALTSRFADDFAWFEGDDSSYIGGPQGTGDVSLFATRDVNVQAGHIRFAAADGNFEFEHGSSRNGAHLIAYDYSANGGVERTPILIGGGDEQDLVSLLVSGKKTQEHDLQQWTNAGTVKAAIDGRGRLRIGRVTLTTTIRGGKALVIAILPSGEQQVLARAG
jgi:hypothetical protein